MAKYAQAIGRAKKQAALERRLSRGRAKAHRKEQRHGSCEQHTAYGRHLTDATNPLCLSCSTTRPRWF